MEMNGVASEQHSLVLKMECTTTFELELIDALSQQCESEVEWSEGGRLQEAWPEPVMEVVLGFQTFVSVLQFIELVRRHVKSARDRRDHGLGKAPVTIAHSREGPFLDIEGADDEDLDELVNRLLSE